MAVTAFLPSQRSRHGLPFLASRRRGAVRQCHLKVMLLVSQSVRVIGLAAAECSAATENVFRHVKFRTDRESEIVPHSFL